MDFGLGELFCGAGGLALAAKNSKVSNSKENITITPIWANDYNADACETYKKNIEINNVICKDVAKLDMEKLPKPDALAFGFPCNDFSDVGKKKGFNGKYGRLYEHCIDALRIFQPKWFLAENVDGLKNDDDGNSLKLILNEMAGTGYNLVPNLYRFQNYGVPQTRHRIIVVGTKVDLDLNFKVPAPLTIRPLTCKFALENPPIPSDAKNHEFTRHAPQVVERLKHTKPGENAFTADLPEHLRLKIKGAKISQIYKKLDPNKPAYTVTGSGGGGTHMYHWAEDRALTNRERARLQTFPDNFVFYGNKENVRKQVGMAVPYTGAKIIFESILKTFAGIPYEYVEANIPWTIVNTQTKLIDAKQISL
jgi:DNA (cytosine-5)-methyltransferase 1